MDKFEKQRKIFTIVAILVFLSVLSLLVVIPRMLQETFPGGLPKAAAIATSVAMGVRLLILIAILFGIRVTKRRGRVNREINLATAVVLILLGLVLMDGAFAYVGSLLFVSIGMFVCVFCDLAAAGVSITGLFRLKPKKKK